jgi:hypothetical protein
MNSKVKLMQILTVVLITTILMLLQISCNSKVQDVEKQQMENAENFQLMPEFIGEEGDLMEYLGYHLAYPEEAIKAGVNIRGIYSFVVEKAGSVTDIKRVATHVEAEMSLPVLMRNA